MKHSTVPHVLLLTAESLPHDDLDTSRYGGHQLRHEPSAELAVAQTALDCVPADLLDTRVDLVGTAEAPLVMELELIEPEISLPTAPGSADRLADAVLARL